MTRIVAIGDEISLTFPKNLLSEKQLVKLIELIEYQQLVEKSAMTEKNSMALDEELKRTWWKENKKRILDKF